MAQSKGSSAPGLIDRAAQAMRGLVSGWNSPGVPATPSLGLTQPLAFDAPWGYNYSIAPKVGAGLSFANLRELAKVDLVRAVIETRKDQVEAMDWQIRPKAGTKATPQDARIVELQAFFADPDRLDQGWSAWLRTILEDLFVLDAVAVYKRPTRGGALYALEIINADTVVPKIDAQGRPFMYQQVSKGMAAFNFTLDELAYGRRNPRSNSVYGYSPVEQIAQTINIASARAARQLGHFVDGNVADGVFWMDPTWDVANLQSMRAWWDSLHVGNQAERRRAKFLSGLKDSYQPIAEPPLKDDFDEWLARVVCYAFSVPPTPFIKQMNRATADNAHDAALEEGLAPILKWVRDFINRIIVKDFKITDLEFAWVDDREIDPEIAAKIQDTKIRNGTLLIDEARAQDGHDPLPDGLGATPGVITQQGFVALPRPELVEAQHDASLAGSEAAADAARNPPEPQDGEENGDDEGNGKKVAAKAARADLKKKYTDPLATHAAKAAIITIHSKVSGIFDNAAHHVATQLRGIHVMGKADGQPDEDAKAKAQDVVDQLNLFDVRDLKTISSPLTDVFADAQAAKLDTVGIDVETGLFGQINHQAAHWATDHAAALVSQITDTTRDQLRATIAQGYADGLDIGQIADRIAGSDAFSKTRASLIANTETAIASGEGSLAGFRRARDLGIKLQKQWLDDPLACPTCRANAAAGPVGIDEAFPSGDLTVPAHPRCSCDVIPVIED